MPRHNRARREPPRDLSSSVGWARPEGQWLVRQVPASSATKTYRCPGCDHEILPGTSHVVAWPALEHGSVSDRRHWHSGCWNARERRGPTTKRW
ncbi:MAG TPA: hypothetical protein VHV74_26315 [Pseudonocardiaceae bacterium]|nr:hypothetical protein [Pseudonocardiaceae bacterium]